MADEHFMTTRYPRCEFREITQPTQGAEKTPWLRADTGPRVRMEDLSARLMELYQTVRPRSWKTLAGWLADRLPSKLWRLESWLQQYAWTVDEQLHVNGQVVHLLARDSRGGLRWRATYRSGATSHLLAAYLKAGMQKAAPPTPRQG